MKELTIEEKAKRYDEAIIRAKSLIGDTIIEESGQHIAEVIFPELKESEDEKIRKAISDILLIDSDEIREILDANNLLMQDIDTWLEKQGKQKSVDDLTSQEVMDIAVAKCFEQGEQNHVYKVEPKFKVGDWVVYHRNDSSTEIMNVYDIRDNRYYFNDNIHFSWSVKECDEKCHIWTIEDAKDGDVLVTGNKNIFIFKSISDCTVYDYCGLYFGKFFEYPSTVNGSTAVQLPIGYTPATKEQCDLLFQKMKEAGYEWDAEKKELKKFDQKSVFEMKTPEESLGIDSDTYNKIVDECVYGEQKSAWSEEDEETLGWLCTFLKKYGHEFYGGNEENVISWLESLKNKYTWKPSDEQLKQLNNVFNDVSAGWEDSVIESLYNDLKKLM